MPKQYSLATQDRINNIRASFHYSQDPHLRDLEWTLSDDDILEEVEYYASLLTETS